MPGKDHVIGVIFFFVVVGLILFHIRRSWVPIVSDWWSRRSIRLDGYNTLASFRRDIEAGLNSDNFNVARDNVNDSRKGLDEAARNEILKIMDEHEITFDEARLKYIKSKFSDNQIGPDGTPLDPKVITFGKLRGKSSS